MTDYEYQQLRTREALGLPLEEPDGPGHREAREYARLYKERYPDYVDPEPPVSPEAIEEYKRLRAIPYISSGGPYISSGGNGMDALLRFGRVLFAIAMVFFGIQFVIFAASLTGPVPGPPWTRGSVVVAGLVAAGFILAGLSIASGKMGRWVSLLLGAAMILFGLIHYGPALVAKPHDPGPWTVLFELLAMGGGAWVIAAGFPPPPAGLPVTRMADVGRYLIAIALVVFAVQHFIYAQFVAGLVTPWIPWHLFWAYFCGIAFVAAALSLVAGRMVRLAATLLGTMFFLWVIVLHIPRVAAAVRNGDEVTSLFVCLGMSGVSFALAGMFENSVKGRA